MKVELLSALTTKDRKTTVKIHELKSDVIKTDLFAHHFGNVDLSHWYSAVRAPTTNEQQLVKRV